MASPLYTMRALANPGPGYVTWQYAYPDYAGVYAPAAILAGTVAVVSGPIPVTKRLPLASDHALAVFCDEAAAPWADSGAMSSGNFTVANGTPDANQPGIIKASIEFKRNAGLADEAVVGPVSPLLSSGITAITLMAWVYPTGAPTTGGLVLGKQREATFSANTFVFCFGISSTYVVFANGYNITQLSSGWAISVNEWTHIAATYDGANSKIFVNGYQMGSLADASGLNWGGATEQARPWWIGNTPFFTTADRRGFVGRIEDARAITRILSDTELRDIVARGFLASAVAP